MPSADHHRTTAKFNIIVRFVWFFLLLLLADDSCLVSAERIQLVYPALIRANSTVLLA